jgi:hypothetical protein
VNGRYSDRSTAYGARLAWPGNPEERIWRGLITVQSHFRARAGSTIDPEWLLNGLTETLNAATVHARQIKTEHEYAVNAGLAKAGEVPAPPFEYLLIVTNVELAGAPEEYGVRLRVKIRKLLKEIGTQDYEILDYFDLCRLLDDNAAIRREYAAYIMPTNSLRSLHNYLPGIPPQLSEVISRSLAMELMADQWVRLSQAGDQTHQKLALSRVAIDLPLQPPEGVGNQAASFIIREGNRPLPARNDSSSTSHIVLLGGPGQGKTTIGQLVCQIYREAMLRNASWIGTETVSLLRSVQQGLMRISVPEVTYWRWPVRVELAAFVDAAAGNRRMSLLRYISDRIIERMPDELGALNLRPWLKAFPWILLLDGLDEVASTEARDLLMDRIADFRVEMDTVDSDVFIVVTTRPQGYVGDFQQENSSYRHVSLDSLSPEQAALYAERLAEVRHFDDPDMRQRLMVRTRIAANDNATARLMSTPLQVTIMALLLEGRERAPQARYALFEAYYDTIYAREVAKPGEVGRLLEEQRAHINALHERIGLALHVQAEGTGGADASLPQTELRNLAITTLENSGYSSAHSESLADKIVAAVVNRLVLLVPKRLDDVGFEVRSIQEFMAARAIVTGTDGSVMQRLRLIAPSVHWRNAWLFAAGRVFSVRGHLRLSLIALLRELDAEEMISMLVAPGADLALDLLDEDIATSYPKLQRMLAQHALTLLDFPPDQDLKRRSLVLFRYAVRDNLIRSAALQAIDQALLANPARAMSARVVGQAWRSQDGLLVDAAVKLLRRPIRRSDHPSSLAFHEASKTTIGRLVSQCASSIQLSPEDREIFRTLIEQFDDVPLLPESTDIAKATELATQRSARAAVEACLSVPSVVDTIVLVTGEVATRTWVGAAELRNLLRAWLYRRPVGEELLALTPFPEEAGE